MSVRISTPWVSVFTRAIACAISSRASSVSSCQPIDTAVNCGRSPTIISAAFTSSVASCPWVTTTTPIMARSLIRSQGAAAPRRSWLRDVPVAHADAHARHRRQRLAQPLADHHRAVAPPRAADADREIALALGDIVRNDVLQVVGELVHELARRGV